jgi:hypothetical protein
MIFYSFLSFYKHKMAKIDIFINSMAIKIYILCNYQ